MTKKNYLKLILTTTLLFFAAIFAAAKINATAPDVNFGNATALTWKEFSSYEDFWDLGTDEIDVWTSITGIADYTNSTDTPEFVAYNSVNAIYTGHTESYIYWVFDGVLEEVHFYNYKFHKSETVAYADLVDVVRYDSPFSDYDNGYNEARDEYAIFINGEWVNAVDYGGLQYNEARDEYGIFINGEWVNAVAYADIKYNDGIDIGFNDGFNYLSKKYLNIEVEGKTSSDEVVFAVGVKYKLVGGSTWSIIDDKGNYLSSGLSRMSLNGNFKVKVFWGSSVYNYTIDSIGSHRSTGGGGSSTSTIKFYINESEVGSHATASTYGTSHPVYIIFEVPNLNRIKYVVDNYNYFNTYNFEGFKGDIVPPLEPYKKNQYFIGWFEEDSEEAFNFDAPLVNDVVLYAIYGLPNTITFNTNGGNNIPSLNEIAGAEVNPPDNPIKSGYEFIGWYSDPNFEEEFEFDLMPDDDITLYAKWEANEYTIEFYLGEELYSTKTVIGNENVILPATPEKEDHVFLGWYYDEDFELKFSLEDEIVEDIILYGRFSSGSGGGSIDDSDETKFKTEYIGYAALVLVGLVVVIGLVKAPKKRKKR